MAIGTGAAILGGALIGGAASSRAGSIAADSSNAAVGEQRRQFDLTRRDLQPYMQIGQQALGTLGGVYGYNTTPQQANSSGSQMTTGNGMLGNALAGGLNSLRSRVPQSAGQQSQMGAPDYSAFFASPDYNFRRAEGTRDIGNSFAARGGALSGNALRALTDYSSNLAGGEFGNWWNRQAGLAGIGQTAVGQSGTFGANSANNIGNALMQGGNARASGVAGVNQAVQGGIGNYLLHDYLRGRQ